MNSFVTHHRLLLSLTTAGLVAWLPAQATSVDVGVRGSYGCQGSEDPPRLSNGTPASATLDFVYDQSTQRLTLRVTNTSPVTVGVANPLITRIAFNLPPGAVTSAQLLSQAGSSGAALAFSASVDGDLFEGPNPNKLACLGDFSVLLDNGGGIQGGIANANADTFGGPPGSQVIGPATFVFRLTGPGVGSVTSGAIANTLSQNAPYRQATAGVKFQAGGRGAAGSGFISSRSLCAPSLFAIGEPRIGTRIQICANAGRGCHGCVLVSANPGPIRIGNVLLPIGLPILHTIILPPFAGTRPNCETLSIPDDPNLRGVRIYFLLIVGDPISGNGEFSHRLEIVIL
jgi:hypothetical protein